MSINKIRLAEIVIVVLVIAVGLAIGAWYLRRLAGTSNLKQGTPATSSSQEIQQTVDSLDSELAELEALEQNTLEKELQEIESALSEQNLSALE